jgi:hypothetical protein
MAGMPWLDVHCLGCGTSRAIDLRTVDRHPLASVGTLVLGLRCSWCPGSAPMPQILGLHALPPAGAACPARFSAAQSWRSSLKRGACGRPKKWPGRARPFSVSDQASRYWAAWALAACRSASLRNAITVTLRVRYEGSTTFNWPSCSYSET